jgi:hypothetical protein
MKCPKCNAELLPVEDEMFCLQCGNVVGHVATADEKGPQLEDTTDPLLQKAIIDSTRKPIAFRSSVGAPAVTALKSLGNVLVPGAALSGPGGTAAMTSVKQTPGLQEKNKPEEKEEKRPERPFLTQAGQSIMHGPDVRLPESTSVKRVTDLKQKSGSKSAWVAGILSFVVFLALNGAVYEYFMYRVMPGVVIGNTYVGGTSFNDLQSRLAATGALPKLGAEVGPTKFDVDSAAADAAWYSQVEGQAEATGRSNPLPLAGLVASLIAKPINAETLTAVEAKSIVSGIATQIDHVATNAVPMIVGDQAFVITDKAGTGFNQAQAAQVLEGAYGKDSNVELGSFAYPINAKVMASGYTNDISLAQTMLGLKISLNEGAATYVPTPTQIGSWLSFNGPGKGITVIPQEVTNYVATIPGSFDRTGAVSAIAQTVNGAKSATIALAGKPVTAVSTLKITTLPHTYSYCLEDSQGGITAAANEAAAVLADPAGWALGGQLAYKKVSNGCSFTIDLVSQSQMTALNPGCAVQTSCVYYNTLVISESAWQKSAKSWTGSLTTYRAGLVDQVVGQWLGFSHTSCQDGKANQQILQQPTVTIDSCSPDWNEIPVGDQNTKILAGF